MAGSIFDKARARIASSLAAVAPEQAPAAVSPAVLAIIGEVVAERHAAWRSEPRPVPLEPLDGEVRALSRRLGREPTAAELEALAVSWSRRLESHGRGRFLPTGWSPPRDPFMDGVQRNLREYVDEHGAGVSPRERERRALHRILFGDE